MALIPIAASVPIIVEIIAEIKVICKVVDGFRECEKSYSESVEFVFDADDEEEDEYYW